MKEVRVFLKNMPKNNFFTKQWVKQNEFGSKLTKPKEIKPEINSLALSFTKKISKKQIKLKLKKPATQNELKEEFQLLFSKSGSKKGELQNKDNLHQLQFKQGLVAWSYTMKGNTRTRDHASKMSNLREQSPKWECRY